MYRSFFLLLLSLLMPFGVCFGASRTVEWEIEKKLPLEAAPLDLAATADGSQLFVLLEGGKLLVCSSEGEIRSQLDVDPQANQIEVAPAGDKLFVTSARNQSFQIVRIDPIFDINTLGSPFRGPARAPVEIAIFSDFQCPYCAKLVPLLEQICTLYPQDVKVVFKNFPLRNHQFARQAAIAALAANEQGKFWPFHDRLFANISQLNETKLREITGEVGLDRSKFENDLKNQKIWAQIDRDIHDAQEVGVRGTPTVLINGKLLRERSLEGFRAKIESEMRKAHKRKEEPT